MGKAFLNPHAKLSRDIGCAYVKLMSKRNSCLLDATAATGIRGIRYYLEGKIKRPVFLEINKTAYSVLKTNLRRNKVKAEMYNTSVQEFANTRSERFDFIDLDPFGGITPYIYDLMKMCRDGTYLMVTATDTAVLCGADKNACMRLYGSKPIHNELCHEGGLRVMLGYIAKTAAQFNFGIRVMFSFSHMHYMRVFVKLDHGSESALASISELGWLHHCNACGYRLIDKNIIPDIHDCKICKKHMSSYGRMWMGAIKEDAVAKTIHSVLKNKKEMKDSEKLASMIANEPSYPFYYSIPKITKRLRIGAVSPASVLDALKRNGFAAAYTHLNDSSIKTNAEIFDLNAAVKGSYHKSHF